MASLRVEGNIIHVEDVKETDAWSLRTINANFMLSRYNGVGEGEVTVIWSQVTNEQTDGNVELIVNGRHCHLTYIVYVDDNGKKEVTPSPRPIECEQSVDFSVTPSVIQLKGDVTSFKVNINSFCDENNVQYQFTSDKWNSDGKGNFTLKDGVELENGQTYTVQITGGCITSDDRDCGENPDPKSSAVTITYSKEAIESDGCVFFEGNAITATTAFTSYSDVNSPKTFHIVDENGQPSSKWSVYSTQGNITAAKSGSDLIISLTDCESLNGEVILKPKKEGCDKLILTYTVGDICPIEDYEFCIASNFFSGGCCEDSTLKGNTDEECSWYYIDKEDGTREKKADGWLDYIAIRELIQYHEPTAEKSIRGKISGFTEEIKCGLEAKREEPICATSGIDGLDGLQELEYAWTYNPENEDDTECFFYMVSSQTYYVTSRFVKTAGGIDLESKNLPWTVYKNDAVMDYTLYGWVTDEETLEEGIGEIKSIERDFFVVYTDKLEGIGKERDNFFRTINAECSSCAKIGMEVPIVYIVPKLKALTRLADEYKGKLTIIQDESYKKIVLIIPHYRYCISKDECVFQFLDEDCVQEVEIADGRETVLKDASGECQEISPNICAFFDCSGHYLKLPYSPQEYGYCISVIQGLDNLKDDNYDTYEQRLTELGNKYNGWSTDDEELTFLIESHLGNEAINVIPQIEETWLKAIPNPSLFMEDDKELTLYELGVNVEYNDDGKYRANVITLTQEYNNCLDENGDEKKLTITVYQCKCLSPSCKITPSGFDFTSIDAAFSSAKSKYLDDYEDDTLDSIKKELKDVGLEVNDGDYNYYVFLPKSSGGTASGMSLSSKTEFDISYDGLWLDWEVEKVSTASDIFKYEIKISWEANTNDKIRYGSLSWSSVDRDRCSDIYKMLVIQPIAVETMCKPYYIEYALIEPVETFDIVFYDACGKELKKINAKSGEMITAPTSGMCDCEANTIFEKWTPTFSPKVTQSVNYSASCVTKKCTIKLYDCSGNLYDTLTPNYGETIATPSFIDCASGWTPTFDNYITKDASYSATCNYYDIKFVGCDGTVLSSLTRTCSERIQEPQPPEGATGWMPSFQPFPTENVTYTAICTPQTYTVTFYDCDGTSILKEVTVDSGERVSAPTDGVCTNCDGDFKGWTPYFDPTKGVEADASYTAICQSDVKYTITFYKCNEEVVEEYTDKKYGETITTPQLLKDYLCEGECAEENLVWKPTNGGSSIKGGVTITVEEGVSYSAVCEECECVITRFEIASDSNFERDEYIDYYTVTDTLAKSVSCNREPELNMKATKVSCGKKGAFIGSPTEVSLVKGTDYYVKYSDSFNGTQYEDIRYVLNNTDKIRYIYGFVYTKKEPQFKGCMPKDTCVLTFMFPQEPSCIIISVNVMPNGPEHKSTS